MTRLPLLLLPPLLVAAAPVPEGAGKPAHYFPVTKGSTWVYEEKGGGETNETITDVERRANGEVVITVRSVERGRSGHRSLKVRVCDRGLLRIESMGRADDPPVCWLKPPATPNTRWTNPWSQGQEEAIVLVPEEVAVPAGRFRAVPVAVTIPAEFGGLKRTYTRWYAEGIGLVKQVGCGPDIVLKSFTPGKD